MKKSLTDVLQALRAEQLTRTADETVPARTLSQASSRALRPGSLFPDIEGDEQRLNLPLPGLFGRHGVLPDYFIDDLFQEHPEKPIKRGFLDIFNNRYFSLLLSTWQRYHFFSEDVLQPKCEHAYREAFYLNCLAGTLKALPGEKEARGAQPSQQEREEFMAFQALRWHKISIYRRRKRSADGLIELLQVFFPDLRIDMKCMVPVIRPLPQTHRFSLNGTMRLGSDGLLGESLVDLAGGIRLEVLDLDYVQYLSLQGRRSPTNPTASPMRALLRQLVNEYTRGKIICQLRLQLRASEVPAWSLGQRDSQGLDMILGQQIWVRSATSEPVSVDVGVI